MNNQITKYNHKYKMAVELTFINNEEKSKENETNLIKILKSEYLSKINVK